MISTVLTAAAGLEHFYILYLEMFKWNTRQVNKIFGVTPEFAGLPSAKILAANQGLYNGFLGAGLLYAVGTKNKEFAYFFNSCVAVAALYGWISTGKPRILMIQGSPAFLALAALALGY